MTLRQIITNRMTQATAAKRHAEGCQNWSDQSGTINRMKTSGATKKATPLDAPVELKMECRSNPKARSSARHQVTINPDWSVETPHDLDAERVAIAFGGYCSCIDLVDKTAPALRTLLAWRHRSDNPGLQRVASGKWRIRKKNLKPQCCHNKTFASPQLALKHALSTDHVAAAYDAPRWQLNFLTKALKAPSWELPPEVDPAITDLVWDPFGVRELWQAGIHPDRIAELAAVAARVGDPFVSGFYINLHYSPIDLDWYRRVLGEVTDSTLASWVVSMEAPDKLGRVEDWQAWLGYGLPRSDIGSGLAGGITSEQVIDVAEVMGWTTRTAARRLAGWTEANCQPTVDDFRILRKYDATGERPSLGAIDWLEDELSSSYSDLGRTDLALMLAILETRRSVREAVKKGIRELSVLDEKLSLRDQ